MQTSRVLEEYYPSTLHVKGLHHPAIPRSSIVIPASTFHAGGRCKSALSIGFFPHDDAHAVPHQSSLHMAEPRERWRATAEASLEVESIEKSPEGMGKETASRHRRRAGAMFEGPEQRAQRGTSDMTGRAHVVDLRAQSIGLLPNRLVATRGTASVRCANAISALRRETLLPCPCPLPNVHLPVNLI